MSTYSLRTDCLEEAYRDVRITIYDLCHRFQLKYGGDFEELVAEANYQMIKAYDKWTPDGGASFKTWVRLRVFKCLLEHKRTEARRHYLCPRVYPDIQYMEAGEGFDLDRFLSEVSADARTVIKVLLDMPLPAVKQPDRKSYRAAIRSFLRQSGWTLARVKESFREIKGALR